MLEQYTAQINDEKIVLLKDLIELGKIVIPALITLLAAYFAYRFANRQLKYKKALEFEERKIIQFYSPILGCRKKIQAHGELREELSQAANTAWQKICTQAPRPFTDHEKRYAPFKKIIEFNNKLLTKEIIPLYEKMLSIFTDNYWLAEESTKQYYEDLCRFVELWHRFLEDSIPYEVLDEIEYQEEKLHPFYEELENQTNRLKKLIAK